jgi:BASS family bile acid:Na+ symporter
MNKKKSFILLITGILFLLTCLSYLFNLSVGTGPWLIGFFISLSLALNASPKYKGFSFTILIFAAVSIAMYYPQYLVELNGFEFKKLIIPLLQIIMFGMGTAMSFKDFYGVIKMPKGVFIGLTCQFTIMPLLGFSLASLFNFPPEIAAGIILIGSSPSGLASNVMAYLARANVALSVTLTAFATLLAPLMTPFLMKYLAGSFVPIDFVGMMTSILKIVIIPVFIGLVFNYFFHGKAKWLDQSMPVVSMAGIALIIMIITAAGRDSLLTIGLLLILVAIIHNLLGYLLGYWSCKLFKMKEQDCRTIAFEVGMQNGGLATGIALEMGKIATVGLAPAIFGPWMNISGSSLATWWRDRTLKK